MTRPATRERLIRSTIELVSSRSYADVGVDELCRHAGVQKGSFYHFFPSKRDLALAAVERQWSETRQHILEPAFATDVSPLERIRRFFKMAGQHHLRQRKDHGRLAGCPFGNLAAEISTQDEILRCRLAAIFDEMAAFFRTALDEAVRAREMAACDTRQASRALVAYLEGVLLLAKSNDDPRLIESLADAALALVPAPRE